VEPEEDVVELVPHAARRTASVTAVNRSRRFRFISKILSRARGQPPAENSERSEPEPDELELELEPPAPEPEAPESETLAATRAPDELVMPRMITVSPGCREARETPRLLLIFVAEESLTFTVLPVLVVR
jgi:hypothetical protein